MIPAALQPLQFSIGAERSTRQAPRPVCDHDHARYREPMIGRDDIAGIAGELPGAYEQASYDQAPSWRTKPRMFAWIRDDPEALVVWVASEEDKLALIAANPAVFFTTAHYDSQPILLVRMPEVDPDEARELIVESWRLRAPKGLVKAWDAEHPSDD